MIESSSRGHRRRAQPHPDHSKRDAASRAYAAPSGSQLAILLDVNRNSPDQCYGLTCRRSLVARGGSSPRHSEPLTTVQKPFVRRALWATAWKRPSWSLISW